MTLEQPTPSEAARIRRALEIADEDPELTRYIASIIGPDGVRWAIEDHPRNAKKPPTL